jgi:hypothetical protein
LGDQLFLVGDDWIIDGSSNFGTMGGCSLDQMLKLILSALIVKYGAYRINDVLAQIFNDRIKYGRDGYQDYTQNKFNDELSEAYDEINRRLFLCRKFK